MTRLFAIPTEAARQFCVLSLVAGLLVGCALPSSGPSTPPTPSARPHLLGNAPVLPVVGFGSIWVPNSGDGTISRVSLSTGQLTAAIKVSDPMVFRTRGQCIGGAEQFAPTSLESRSCDSPSAVAVAGGAIWATRNEDDAVVRIDPQTNTVTQTRPIGGTPWALMGTDGSLWVSDYNDDLLVRIDAVTGTILDRITKLAHGPTEMTLGTDTNLWVVNARAGVVTRIDQGTGQIIAVIPVGGNPQSIVSLGEELWARTQQGIVVRIDARTNMILGQFEMPDAVGRPGLDRLAVTPTGVWMPGATLRLVDRTTRQVAAEIPISCYAVVVGQDDLWVVDVTGQLVRVRS